MTKRIGVGVVGAFVIAAFFTITGFQQTGSRGKSHTLHGTVEGINAFAQSIRVRQEKIEGYSDARIATYGVNDAAILKRLEVGDRIAATIYEKDDVLYDIRVAIIYDTDPRRRY